MKMGYTGDYVFCNYDSSFTCHMDQMNRDIRNSNYVNMLTWSDKLKRI